MKKILVPIRIIAFVTVLVFLLVAMEYVFVRPGDQSAFRNMDGFYMQDDNTLDAVYIGSSRVYAFWNPVYAFARSGMTVYSFATAAQPIEAARYLVEEAHKSHPNAVMIVNLEPIHEEMDERWRRVADKMKLSSTKVRFVWEMGEEGDERILHRIRNLFPLIRYHYRWKELQADDFLYETDKYKGSSRYDTFLTAHTDVLADYTPCTGEANEPTEDTKKSVDALLAYCEEEHIELLFTLAPQAGIGDEQMRNRTGLRDYIVGKGGTVLDYQNCVEEIGLDFTRDYDNTRHVNIHGSFKFTGYLADELNSRYHFTDKRGAKGYESWDQAVEDYHVLADPNVFPFEWQAENRTDLPEIAFTAQALPEGGVSLAFDPVEGADGYTVYRKQTKDADWKQLGDTAAGVYTDPEGKAGCVYAVVAYAEKDGTRLYGDVDYEARVTAA